MKNKNLRQVTNESNAKLTEAEVHRLLTELQTHQIELELQNEELLLANEKASIASVKYAELYDFAPIGYFTLSPKTEILELNLAGAKILGKDRSYLKTKRFGLSVSDDTKTIFNLFLDRVFSSEVSETCEVTLATNGNPPIYVQLIGIKSPGGESCNISAINQTGRVQAEEKMRAEQAFRNSIESSLSNGIAVIDDEGHQIYVNPSFCKLFGWSAEELIGETAPFSYWPTDQLEAINEAFQLTLAHKAPTEGFELVFVRKDGVRIPVQVIITPFYDGKRRTGWLANVTDISARKKAEAMFQNIINMNPMSIQIVDMEGFTIIANKAYVSLFGAVPPSDFSIFNDLQSKGMGELVLLAKKGEVIHFPDMYYNVHDVFSNLPDKPVWIRAILFPLEDSIGTSKLLAFMHEDITDRKQAEKSIHDLNWRLESIIEGTHVGTWEWNVQTGEAIFNEVWAKIIGYTIDELRPISIKTWKAYTHPDDLKKSEELLEQHFSGKLADYECECRMKHKNGHWVWIHDLGSVITRTTDGKPLMMFGTHYDITERKEAELQILLKNEELQKLNATKDKFFSIIAHDLRSPFNSILGFSDLLLEQIIKKEYEGVENYAQIIKKSSGQAIKLLMNLMEWSQLQTGRMVFNPEYFELVNVVNEVDHIFLEIFRQKEITIRKILPQSATVYADKNMISTVLRNLFSNAVKFSHPGGTVTISVQDQQNELSISISDTGIGMAKTRMNKLFLIDESYSTIGTQNEKGSGLGLILCKEFVDKNGGKIWAESIVGTGSTFYFTLPRQEKSDEKNVIQIEFPTPALDTWMNTLKILIVEDDETSEKLLAIQVKKFSKEVREAITGVEAVDICRQNPDIDLILMDIQLPVMDGYEATRQIREFNKDVIIIALTAYGIEQGREKARQAGCNDYDTKPVSKDQLIKMIQKYFHNLK